MRTVLFVCVHNSGRSQMAEGLLNALAKARGLEVRAVSAGTIPGENLNLLATEAMEEIGIPLKGQFPKRLDAQMFAEADRVITMGCGVEAEACPATAMPMEDWGLDDPAGQDLATVRVIRDQIKLKVETLLDTFTD